MEEKTTVIQEVEEEVFEPITNDGSAKETALIFGEDTDDLGSEDLAFAEEQYRNNQLNEQMAPIVKEKVEEAVHTTVKLQNDRLKLEMTEVLDSEVNRRLDKYDKRRRRRRFFEGLRGVVKLAVIVGILLLIFSNDQIKSRAEIIIGDVIEIVQGVANNEEVSSNELVQDIVDSFVDERD